MNNAFQCCIIAVIISHSLAIYSCSKTDGAPHNMLPAIASTYECDTNYGGDVCAWARAADAIGWVRIETIGFVYEPTIKASWGSEVIDSGSCDANGC